MGGSLSWALLVQRAPWPKLTVTIRIGHSRRRMDLSRWDHIKKMKLVFLILASAPSASAAPVLHDGGL